MGRGTHGAIHEEWKRGIRLGGKGCKGSEGRQGWTEGCVSRGHSVLD